MSKPVLTYSIPMKYLNGNGKYLDPSAVIVTEEILGDIMVILARNLREDEIPERVTQIMCEVGAEMDMGLIRARFELGQIKECKIPTLQTYLDMLWDRLEKEVFIVENPSAEQVENARKLFFPKPGICSMCNVKKMADELVNIYCFIHNNSSPPSCLTCFGGDRSHVLMGQRDYPFGKTTIVVMSCPGNCPYTQ